MQRTAAAIPATVASILLLVAAPRAFADDAEQPVDRPSTKLLKLLRAGEHAKLEKECDTLRAAGRFPQSWEDQLESAVEHLVENRSIAPDLDRWCDKSPKSWAAFLVRGKLRTTLAWDARGSGWAKSVQEEG